MDMKSSNVQEVEKVEEIDNDKYPEKMKLEESEKKLDAIRVSALDTMLKSLRKISLFISDEEEHKKFGKEYDQFLSELSRTNPLEENAAFEFIVTILDLMPRYNSDFKVYEVSKKNCNRCRMDTEYPPECSYGIIINAHSTRDIKSAFNNFMFESIVKIIRINLKMECEKKGCGKRNYVQRLINELPSVFTIGLEWENNETEKEIFDTILDLGTEIDISKIYKYEGDSTSTKYHLVSMVCLCKGDEYSCVAYERNRWVRYFGSDDKGKVIGNWTSVAKICSEEEIRPKILFYENVMKRDKLVKL